MVESAERFMEARNTYDAEMALSLLADDGVTVLPTYNNGDVSGHARGSVEPR